MPLTPELFLSEEARRLGNLKLRLYKFDLVFYACFKLIVANTVLCLGCGFLNPPGKFISKMDAANKESTLRKELLDRASAFKHEPEVIKKKARDLYKVALKAIESCELMRTQLNAYKQPKLFPKDEAGKIPERIYYTLTERLAKYFEDDDEEGLKNCLKWNGLTLEEAKELVYKAKEVK